MQEPKTLCGRKALKWALDRTDGRNETGTSLLTGKPTVYCKMCKNTAAKHAPTPQETPTEPASEEESDTVRAGDTLHTAGGHDSIDSEGGMEDLGE